MGVGVGFTGSHPSFLYGPCGFSIVIVVADEGGQSSGVFSSFLTNPQTRALHCDNGSIASAKGSGEKAVGFSLMFLFYVGRTIRCDRHR